MYAHVSGLLNNAYSHKETHTAKGIPEISKQVNNTSLLNNVSNWYKSTTSGWLFMYVDKKKENYGWHHLNNLRVGQM